jgi:release factor glutamine methyltransferase
MRVAGNKIKHISDFFYAELKDHYSRSEITAMLSTAILHFLGYSKTQLNQKMDENVNQSDLIKLYDCCKDLKKHIPLQYILKETWFYNLPFFVDKYVLIPRPETEELVELVLKENKAPKSVLDIGTGSGCIPVAIKKNLPAVQVFACDISGEALEVAKKNARTNNMEVEFFKIDILKAKNLEKNIQDPVEIIISNPPYIKKGEKSAMEKNVLDNEPHLALFVEGNDEIIFYRKIIDLCSSALSSKGKLYFELNPLTASDVKVYADHSKQFEKVELVKDMSGAVRFLKAVRK